jgi:hypothetical protein
MSPKFRGFSKFHYNNIGLTTLGRPGLTKGCRASDDDDDDDDDDDIRKCRDQISSHVPKFVTHDVM